MDTPNTTSPSATVDANVKNVCQCLWHLIRLTTNPDLVNNGHYHQNRRSADEEVHEDPLPFAGEDDDDDIDRSRLFENPPTYDVRELLSILRDVSQCDVVCHNEDFCRALHGSGGISAILYLF